MLTDLESLTNTVKRCSKCGKEYPANTQYFCAHKKGKYGLFSWCKECQRESSKAYTAADPAKHRERVKASYHKHLKKSRERNLAYNRTHREKRRAYQRSYMPTYRNAHRDQAHISSHRYRALKRSAQTSSIAFDEKAQLKRQQGKCYYCLSKLTSYHIEHVVPLSRGGSDHPDNKVLSCPKCNLTKRNRLPHEWVDGGRLL